MWPWRKGKADPPVAATDGNAEGEYVELPKVSAFPLAPAAPEPIQNAADGFAAATASPRAVKPAACVEVRVGFLTGTYELEAAHVTIGRADPDRDVRPDIDLSSDDAVSRRHAEIRRKGAGYALIDLGSTNGTQLNGETVPPHAEVPLADGDEITLGAVCSLKVHLLEGKPHGETHPR